MGSSRTPRRLQLATGLNDELPVSVDCVDPREALTVTDGRTDGWKIRRRFIEGILRRPAVEFSTGFVQTN